MDELPFKAFFGVYGSYLCLLINILCLMAQFYVALYPVGGPNLNAQYFFESYLAGPFLIALYLIWKVYSWFYRPADRPLWVPIKNIDIYSGMRDYAAAISGPDVPEEHRRASISEMQAGKKKQGFMGHVKGVIGNVI